MKRMTFKHIFPGTFCREDGTTITLTKGYYLQTTPVTQGQWKAVMGSNPSYFKDCGDDCPVENVSWDDVQEFLKKLSQKEGKTYRLPTEAEWEYACRAGTTTDYYFGKDAADLGDYAWYFGNSGNKTHPVGQKRPNDWGFYDMLGNVWEWCQDWYRYYSSESVVDPTGSSTGAYRVHRGGSWHDNARDCSSAVRYGTPPGDRFNDAGFRLISERSEV